MNKRLFYPAVFHRAEEGGFWVTFPDIPECMTQGEDMQEAYEMAADALGLSLTTIDNEGETLPKASSADEITVEDGILVIVEFDIAEYRRKNRSRAVKKTLSIPEWLNEAAIRENLNFSQVLQDALMAKLGMNRYISQHSLWVLIFYVIGNYSVMFLLHKNAPRGCDQMHEEYVC